MASNNITLDGYNKIVTINNITNYNGLIRNGTGSNSGFTNITIQNIGITSSGSTTLNSGAGWICQSFFGRNITNGTISVQNCYSTGNIGINGGGIFGYRAGQSASGTISANNCYSTGNIGQFGGGIFGYYAGQSASGNISVQNCYSTGNIGSDGGGILGAYAGQSASGTISVQNCYSTGTIGDFGGGIFGYRAGYQSTSATISAINCYTIGKLTTADTGIYGSNLNTSICTTSNSIASGTTSASAPWSDAAATATIKTSPSQNSWIDYSVTSNVPWLLSSFNNSIYNPNTQTLTYGSSSSSSSGLFTPDYNYSIISNSISGISINSTSGILTFSNTLSTGTYIINVLVGKLIDSTVYYAYNSANYTLTVKYNQTITFSALATNTYGDNPFELTASASSGLTVTYTSSNTNVATISSNVVTIVGTGSSIITASQSGNSNYYAATNVPQTLTVNNNLSITTQPQTQTVAVGVDIFLTVIVDSFDSVTYTWFKDSEIIPNSNSSTLTLYNASFEYEATYYVKVSDNSTTIYSDNAIINVLYPNNPNPSVKPNQPNSVNPNNEYYQYTQIYNQMYNQIYNQIYNQMYNQIYNQLYIQLNNAIFNNIIETEMQTCYIVNYYELNNIDISNYDFNNENYNILYNKIYNTFYEPLYQELYNLLYIPLYNSIYQILTLQEHKIIYNSTPTCTQITLDENSEIYKLYIQMKNQLFNQLYDQLFNQIIDTF